MRVHIKLQHLAFIKPYFQACWEPNRRDHEAQWRPGAVAATQFQGLGMGPSHHGKEEVGFSFWDVKISKCSAAQGLLFDLETTMFGQCWWSQTVGGKWNSPHLAFLRFGNKRRLCGDWCVDERRVWRRIASSASSPSSYEHLEPTRSDSAAPEGGDVALRCSFTLKGGKGQCHSWVKEAQETDCILGVCVYSSVSHVRNVQYLPTADIYYCEASVYSGRPGLSRHLASFIVSVSPLGCQACLDSLSLTGVWCWL